MQNYRFVQRIKLVIVTENRKEAVLVECEVEAYLGENKTEWRKAEFMGLFQYSEVIGPSLIQGGHNGGVIAFPMAVVKIDGELQNIKINKVRFSS